MQLKRLKPKKKTFGFIYPIQLFIEHQEKKWLEMSISGREAFKMLLLLFTFANLAALGGGALVLLQHVTVARAGTNLLLALDVAILFHNRINKIEKKKKEEH